MTVLYIFLVLKRMLQVPEKVILGFKSRILKLLAVSGGSNVLVLLFIRVGEPADDVSQWIDVVHRHSNPANRRVGRSCRRRRHRLCRRLQAQVCNDSALSVRTTSGFPPAVSGLRKTPD